MRPVGLLLRLHEPLSGGRGLVRLAAGSIAVVLAVDLALAGAAGALAAGRHPGARLGLILTAPADSLESPGLTTRVSLGLEGEQLSTPSGGASISADGRYVVFRTSLTSATGIDLGQILLRDRQAGTTTLVAQGAITAGIAVAVSSVSDPVISGDGRWVAFVSGSTDPAGSHTILIWDRTTGQSGLPARFAGSADQPALSYEGRFLAFRTSASYVKADTNGLPDVYVLDRQTGTFDLASAGPGGGPGLRGQSGEPAISADGRFVAFASSMIRLVDQSVPAGRSQIYLRDRTSGTTRLLSVGLSGQAGDLSSETPSIAGDGTVVAFASGATNLVPGDANTVADVFSWDAASGTIRRLSVSSEGAEADGASRQPSISADGRTVAFASSATNLVPGDSDDVEDIFVHDLVTGRTSRVSVGPGPSQAHGASAAPAVSASGEAVAFESVASNLVGDDTNQARDVFVRDRPSAITLTPDPVDFGTVAIGGPAATQTVTITNTGTTAVAIQGISVGGPSAGQFALTDDGCSGRTLGATESCQVTVTLTPTIAGSASGVLHVDDTAPGAPHTDGLLALVLAASEASITLSPPVGPPGTVVAVTGTGFAPGQPVTLTWDTGVTPVPLAPIVAAPDGTLRAQALVLPNDILGPRNLIAASQVNGQSLPPATAPFLVEPHTAQPPVSSLIWLFIPAPRPSLIFRH